ncbi:MAG: cupin domain-containing protein [Methanobacteriota archaeon]|nr:MAG: cupin domain-containing protein [Euryarchaeota archaeon]
MKKVSQDAVSGSSPEGTKGVVFKQLIAKDAGAPNFYLRIFDVSPGGHTPKHAHDWEHEVYVVKGSGKIVLEAAEEMLSTGDALLVSPGELHQFVNDGSSMLRMICVIPRPEED